MAINKDKFLSSIRKGISKHTPIGVAQSAYKLGKAGVAQNISQFKARQGKRKVVSMLHSKLPTTIMKKKGGEAYKKIRKFVKTNDYKGARKYTKSQLETILKQVKGTGSEEWVKDQLNKIK